MRVVGAALWLLAASAAGQTPPPVTTAQPTADMPGDEVVVTAGKRRCDLSIADRLISDREFRDRAREWAAGRPVRIVVPDGASYRCQARIVFRLGKYGVHRAVFVTR